MNKKKKIILLIIILTIILLGVVWFLNLNNNKKLALNDDKVNHEIVDKLYESVEGSECNSKNYLNEKTSLNDLNKESLLYLIFSKMDKTEELSDEILIKDYKRVGREIFGDNNIDIEFNTYNYGGYTYTLKKDKITRNESECSKEKYLTKLYGYSNNDNTLEMYVNMAYIKNRKVYNMENKEIADYEETKINDILDKGSVQVYIYKLKNGKYFLESIKTSKI